MLVVDDNEINRDMLRRRLERDGHTVRCAENGRQALEMLRAEDFDLVLLDILMPEMNGYQVLEAMKARPRAAAHPGHHDLRPGRDRQRRALHRDRGRGLPAQAVQPRAAARPLGACLEKKRLRDREVLHLRQIEEEKKQSDELLHVILPHEIVRGAEGEQRGACRGATRTWRCCSATSSASRPTATRQPEEIVAALQQLFEAYEELAARHDMYKIKTIGDSFMARPGCSSRWRTRC